MSMSLLSELLSPQLLAIVVIMAAIVFELGNGGHDASSSITTIVRSKVLKPWQAVTMASVCNFLGARFGGVALAVFMTTVVKAHFLTLPLLLAALLGGTVLTLGTWWLRMPVSSTYCYLSSLAGTAIAAGGTGAVNWTAVTKAMWAVPVSLVAVTIVAASLAAIAKRFLGNNDLSASPWRYIQVPTSAFVAFSHGTQDPSRAYFSITAALSLGWPAIYSIHQVPSGVILVAACTMAAGTAFGGWRVVATIGSLSQDRRISPLHGAIADAVAAAALWLGSNKAVTVPLSTTVETVTAVGATGLGLGKRAASRLSLTVVLFWLLTVPAGLLLGIAGYALLPVSVAYVVIIITLVVALIRRHGADLAQATAVHPVVLEQAAA